MKPYELITILGPTASGKTGFAARLAHSLNAEIISADSRQVYRQMDIGTGKDLSDYEINGSVVPYHLIDILDAGEKYNVFAYQHDFHQAFSQICRRGRTAILCGGTGMYIEAVLKGYRLLDVPENKELRSRLENKSLQELTQILASYGALHNTTDVDTAQRAIRAIEIADYTQVKNAHKTDFEPLNSLIVGIDIPRDIRRKRISERLHSRLKEGMLDEVQQLLAQGISPDDLIYYGLEYKFVTLHAMGQLGYNDMVQQLEIAIHQFAKRQMTWFRGMERRGFRIHWLPYDMPAEQRISQVTAWYNHT